jgi:hypothetical protein
MHHKWNENIDLFAKQLNGEIIEDQLPTKKSYWIEEDYYEMDF